MNERLAAVGRLAACGRVADIGADHGLLSRWLAGQASVRHVHATERLPRGEASLRATLGDRIAAGRVSVHLGDGLAPLAGLDLDAVVLAGMGGRTIVRILSAAAAPRRVVLQPQSEPWRVRRWLFESGWGLVEELYAHDAGRNYLVLCAEPDRDFAATKPSLPVDDLFHAGPLLVARRDRRARAVWRRREGELASIVARAGTATPAARELARSRRILAALGKA